jgi:hypothetical protein
MLTSGVASGRSGVFPCDRGEGAVVGSANLVEDLVRGVDNVRPEREVLGECKLHPGVLQKEQGVMIEKPSRVRNFIRWMGVPLGLNVGLLYTGGTVTPSQCFRDGKSAKHHKSHRGIHGQKPSEQRESIRATATRSASHLPGGPLIALHSSCPAGCMGVDPY